MSENDVGVPDSGTLTHVVPPLRERSSFKLGDGAEVVALFVHEIDAVFVVAFTVAESPVGAAGGSMARAGNVTLLETVSVPPA